MRFNYAAFGPCEGSCFDSLITSTIVVIFFPFYLEEVSNLYLKRWLPYLNPVLLDPLHRPKSDIISYASRVFSLDCCSGVTMF
jgi:hypothetical protein